MAKLRKTLSEKSRNKVKKRAQKTSNKAKGRSNKSRKNNHSYTDDDLKNALEEMKIKKTSVYSISKKYKIPRTTLIYKANGTRPPTIRRPGPQCVLGDDTERAIVVWLVESVQKGVPISRSALKFSVKKLVEETGIENLPFKNNTPGRKWINSFKDRHPEITERRSEFIHQGRANVSEKNFRAWFKEVEEGFVNNMDILQDPKRVFNTDETSISLHPKRGLVFCAKKQKIFTIPGPVRKKPV